MINTEKGCTSCQGSGYEILADLFCIIYALKKNGEIPFSFVLMVILEAVRSVDGAPRGLEALLGIDDDEDRGLPN